MLLISIIINYLILICVGIASKRYKESFFALLALIYSIDIVHSTNISDAIRQFGAFAVMAVILLTHYSRIHAWHYAVIHISIYAITIAGETLITHGAPDKGQVLITIGLTCATLFPPLIKWIVDCYVDRNTLIWWTLLSYTVITHTHIVTTYLNVPIIQTICALGLMMYAAIYAIFEDHIKRLFTLLIFYQIGATLYAEVPLFYTTLIICYSGVMLLALETRYTYYVKNIALAPKLIKINFIILAVLFISAPVLSSSNALILPNIVLIIAIPWHQILSRNLLLYISPLLAVSSFWLPVFVASIIVGVCLHYILLPHNRNASLQDYYKKLQYTKNLTIYFFQEAVFSWYKILTLRLNISVSIMLTCITIIMFAVFCRI